MSTETQRVPVMIYTESTPNPATLKFVLNRPLFPNDYYEFEGIEDTENAPLAKALFEIDGVIGVFISNNFVTISKNDAPVTIIQFCNSRRTESVAKIGVIDT